MQPTLTSSLPTAASATSASPKSASARDATSGRRSGSARRKQPRKPLFAPISLRLAGGVASGKLIAARLVDVSNAGVGVRTTRPLAPDTEFTLEVPSAVVKAFRYRVLRCVQVDSNDFHIAAAFVRVRATPSS